MKTEIQTNLEKNLERVGGLVKLYQDSADGKGRRPVAAGDILRSAVVFLHASQEDLLRSSLQWKWPLAASEHFEKLSLAGFSGERFSLAQLTSHRHKSVQQVLEESVKVSLERSTYNNSRDLRQALDRLGVAHSVLAPHGSALDAMMRRRHLIVHRADRNETRGRGHHMARSLSTATVEHWQEAVRAFGADLLAAL